MNQRPIDVLIVGAGPTGTALAIDLARRGLAIRVIDRSGQAFEGSRAKGIQPRTLEVLYDLDAVDDIIAGGSEYPKLGIHLGPFTIPWRMIRKARAGEDIPYRTTWLVPQYTTDRTLHARLQRLGTRVQFGRQLIDFTQTAETVTVRVSAADGGSEDVTARYLVGADGGSSLVRTQLGIGFEGTTDAADRMLIVDAVTTGLSRDRWHVWPARGGRFMAACPLPHSELYQWMIRLAPDEEPPRDLAEITERIHSQSRERRIGLRDIRWRSVFRPNIRLANTYRSRRVFLAGDAAHVHTPAGGQGLNTGIQDAYNLGWKLAQVLAGADERLLDTYEAERRPIAAAVLGLSTKKYAAFGKLDPSSIQRGKDEQQLLLTYHGGPLAPASAEHTVTLRVGDRAPDAAIMGAKRFRMFEAFQGPHFTSIAYGARAADELERLDWPSSGARLNRIVVDAAAALEFPRIYGLTTDTLLLIRPDGYIGHIAMRDMLTTTRAAVRAMAPESQSVQFAGSST